MKMVPRPWLSKGVQARARIRVKASNKGKDRLRVRVRVRVRRVRAGRKARAAKTGKPVSAEPRTLQTVTETDHRQSNGRTTAALRVTR